MQKQKTHSGTKKRFRLTKNRKVKAGHPNTSHFLEKKSGARKRSLSGLGTVESKTNAKKIKQKLGV